MNRRRMAAIALSGALLAGGTGAAIAAVTKDEPHESEQAILADAAKRLDVTPEQLRDALSGARDAQLDEEVKAGNLTRKQADLIKEHRKKAGLVLGNKLFLGHPGMKLRMDAGGKPVFPGRRGFGPGRAMRLGVLPDLAKAIGITREQLRDGLRDGKSIADLARAEGTSLHDVRATLKAQARTAADKAVKDGDLTRSQADKLLEHLDDRLEHLGEMGALPRRFHRGKGPDVRPGNFVLPAPPAATEPEGLELEGFVVKGPDVEGPVPDGVFS